MSVTPIADLKQTIKDFKTTPLDSKQEERIHEKLEQWRKAEEVELNILKRDNTFMKRKLNINTKDVKNVKRKVAKLEQNVKSKDEFMTESQYLQRKQVFTDDLIEFYRRRHSKVQLSPLFEDSDTPLATFYIMPEINKNKSGKEDKILKLESLFKFKTGKSREVYLTADAGLGKTTFSKFLSTLWCQAHRPEERDVSCFKKNDVDCLLGFEFVFLVLLRDSSDLCSIDDLIYELIVSNLAHVKQFDKRFLEEILNREKCLIILDGLDEWNHPETPGNSCYKSPQAIPHRNDRTTCTFLTTTRPWKLGVLDLRNSNESGKQVYLAKLSKESAITLTERSLQRLKFLHDEMSSKKEATKLMAQINTSNNSDLVSVPLLLMYIICLWCDGIKIGNSRSELYIKIVELLVSRTIAKHGGLQLSCRIPISIPDCFIEHEHCRKYFTLLGSLGKLAYHTLYNSKKENTLVFDGSVARTYLIKQDMEFSLLSGLLTESTTKTLTLKTSKVSFSHKTVQEFFAAIFISSQSDSQKLVVEHFDSLQRILDMSTVCQFISGIDANLMCKLLAGFMSVINKEEKTRDYRTKTNDVLMHENPLYDLQNMVVSCFEEMPKNETVQLCLQDFFIDYSSRACLQRLIKMNKNNMKSLYVRAFGNSSQYIKYFSLTCLNNLEKLRYQSSEDEKVDIHPLLSHSLQSLSLYEGNWTENKANLNERLDLMQNLRYLDINDFKFSHEILETFLNFLSSKNTLREVTLYEVKCTTYHYCEEISLDLSQHSQLKAIDLCGLPPLQLYITTPSLADVKLQDLDLSESSLLLSPKMLNIKRVLLDDVKMSVECLQKIVNALENLPQSVKIEINDCCVEPENECDRLMDYICVSEAFDVTYIDSDYREEEGGYEEYKIWSCELITRNPSKGEVS